MRNQWSVVSGRGSGSRRSEVHKFRGSDTTSSALTSHVSSNKGVTLIELIVTMAILGILASIVMPLAKVGAKRAREFELRRDLRTIRTAIDEYKKAYDEGRIRPTLGGNGYPKSLSLLVEGVDDVKSPKSGAKIRFLRRIPRDPMSPDKTIDPENSWGLRSYDSDADSPREGDDVYDVYSISEETGLDGTPYKEW